MSKKVVIGLSVAGVLALLGWKYFNKLKKGLGVVIKQPEINFSAISQLALPVTANLDIFNHSTSSINLDSVRVEILFKPFGASTFSSIGENEPLTRFIAANSKTELSIDIQAQLTQFILSIPTILSNKGKNELKTKVTITVKGIQSVEEQTINV